MKLWVLGSGSRGNAVLLEAGGSRVLIDAGFAPRTLGARLAALGIAGESIEAVVLTHEHADHVRGACSGARRWGWTLYATEGTSRVCPELRAHGARCFRAGATLELTALSLEAVATPHDAAEPVAFVATARASGARAAVAYDFGSAGSALRRALRQLDVLVLEANHDEGMLRAGPYPPSVRERIGGRRGHLSNDAAAVLAQECAHRQLGHVVLAHLSESCNDPGLATATVRAALARTRFAGLVQPAPQDAVIGPFAPRTVRRASSVQLTLEL